MQRKELSITSGMFLTDSQLSLILRKYQDNPNEGIIQNSIIFKIIGLLFSKVSRLRESRLKNCSKVKEAKGRRQLNAISDPTGSFFYKWHYWYNG